MRGGRYADARRGARRSRPPTGRRRRSGRTRGAACALSGMASRPSVCRRGETTVFDRPVRRRLGLPDRGDRAWTIRRSRRTADLLLITHEHADHNAVGGHRRGSGDRALHRRATAVADRRGRRRSPPSTTRRPGPSGARTRSSSSSSTVLRVAHFGDFGQQAPARRAGRRRSGRSICCRAGRRRPDARRRRRRRGVRRLEPRWVVPMHYRTPRIGFLETADGFLELMPHVHRSATTGFETSELPAEGVPLVVVPAVP